MPQPPAEFETYRIFLPGSIFTITQNQNHEISFSKTAFVISAISAGIFLACNSSDNASTTIEKRLRHKLQQPILVSRGQYLGRLRQCPIFLCVFGYGNQPDFF